MTFLCLSALVLHHRWTTNTSPLCKSDIQSSRSLFPRLSYIQIAMFLSSFWSFKLHFPKSFFGDELAPTVALQSGLIFSNTLENEKENDMKINITFCYLIRTRVCAWAALCLESITHYTQLLTFLSTGSSVNISARIVIDKMSLLIEKCPHFLTS